MPFWCYVAFHYMNLLCHGLPICPLLDICVVSKCKLLSKKVRISRKDSWCLPWDATLGLTLLGYLTLILILCRPEPLSIF
jgi:hypothetical protein